MHKVSWPGLISLKYLIPKFDIFTPKLFKMETTESEADWASMEMKCLGLFIG